MSLSTCLVALLLGVASVVSSDVVEWPLDLFDIANANKNTNCEGVEFLKPPGHYAGYFKLSDTQDGHLSYMYFQNRHSDPDVPLVFWTNGGPGCSSYFGLFLENGPYVIQKDLSLCWNEYGWDIGHNVLFVEQPVNVGFSYSRAERDRVFSTEERVGEDMVAFFHAFFKRHPELVKNDLYISGESYAGRYLPSIAKAILVSNAQESGQYLNFKGVFLINPWTSPAPMYYSYPEYAYQEALIGKGTRDAMLSAFEQCDQGLRACDRRIPIIGGFICNSAYAYCQARLFQPVVFLHPRLNIYDIRRNDCTRNLCYDITPLEHFLNNPKVKAAMGVKRSIKWEGCKDRVRREMGWELAIDSSGVVAHLLDSGLRFTVVVGDQDYICNYIGNERWTDLMKWSKDGEWSAAKRLALKTDKGSGYTRQVPPFSFVKVKNSGHMVPMDQPALGLELLTTFTRGKEYPTVGSAEQVIT